MVLYLHKYRLLSLRKGSGDFIIVLLAKIKLFHETKIRVKNLKAI